MGTAASASNDDDDAKGFSAIVERALLAHARSQLLRPKLAALPWAIANLNMPVWAQFVYSRDDDNAAGAGTGGSAGSLGSGIGQVGPQWWQPSHGTGWLVGRTGSLSLTLWTMALAAVVLPGGFNAGSVPPASALSGQCVEAGGSETAQRACLTT